MILSLFREIQRKSRSKLSFFYENKEIITKKESILVNKIYDLAKNFEEKDVNKKKRT